MNGIGLSLLFAEARRPRRDGGDNSSCEITVKIHRGRIRACNRWRTSSGQLKPSNSVVSRSPGRKRLYDLFARLYDFIVLLSGALRSSSLHSLPGLGTGKERSLRAKISDRSIVDDDTSVHAAMQSLLKSLGFVAFVSESAEEFLRSPRVDDSSCLIADVQMPGMSGLYLPDRLIAQGSRIPIIFITAFSEHTIRRSAQAGGALGFLNSPSPGRL
jgi:CheY-like chemotaxis protein